MRLSSERDGEKPKYPVITKPDSIKWVDLLKAKRDECVKWVEDNYKGKRTPFGYVTLEGYKSSVLIRLLDSAFIDTNVLETELRRRDGPLFDETNFSNACRVVDLYATSINILEGVETDE